MGSQVEMGDYSIIRPFTLINLNGQVMLSSYSEISSFNLIYGSSSLIVGDGSYIGPQSMINADEVIRIGRESALGPRTMIFTHGSFFPYIEGYWVKMAGVAIGDKVWCAAGVFIHPGVEIGDNTFVNSRAVVTQSIPTGSVVEGNPAKIIYPMEKIKRKMSSQRVDFALQQILQDFAEIGLRRELGLRTIEETKSELCFQWRGQDYLISIIPSTGESPSVVEPTSDARRIFIVNCPGWSPPSQALIFDLETLQTVFSSDHIHTALRLFMQRFYGIKFRDKNRSDVI
jgi:acetyltransferase-like isoleucine patch superfamily enzyme